MDPCDITTTMGKKNVSCYQRSVVSKQLPVKIKAARLKLKPMILMSCRKKKKSKQSITVETRRCRSLAKAMTGERFPRAKTRSARHE